ncbi:hypothetical protein BJI46_13450 [Acinetobacter qingfengensis]|uniref:DUF2799 domain-containing protein n=2 Tax=Acinetobacter qingfengensis TaxID=1262585 RepID=A0A1E7R5R0_9GAMM|nr:hypothetical protein BJI46_13450 [Acinetobacter qingfengensis]
MKITLFMLLSSCIVLSGCQVMSATECEVANWADLGRQDGLKGYTSRIDSRVKSCNKKQIAVNATDRQQYQQAYQSAILQYCQPKNIYQLSIIGQGSISACPEPNRSRVRAIHDTASRYYNNKQDIESKRNNIRDIDRKIDKVTDKDERYKLLEQQRQLSKDLNHLLEDQIQLERELELVKP